MTISRKLNDLRAQSQQAFDRAHDAASGYEEVADDILRVYENYLRAHSMAGQAGLLLNEVDREFRRQTALDHTDLVLLFLCTAIQCVRQYVLTGERFRLQDDVNADGGVSKSSSQKGDELMQKVYGTTVGQFAPPSWEDILFQSVPYDAIKKGPHIHENIGISGTTHRYRTLGHDPILGWVFGTANILTNSLTKHNWKSYQVKDQTIIRRYPGDTPAMLQRTVRYATDDPKLLVCAVARQAIHFGSDMFTKQGLPLPLVMTVNNDLAKDMLAKWHIDTYSVSRGMALASFINSLIYSIHMLFYNPETDGPQELYQVRTRKVLSISNALATGSNVLVTAVTKDVSKLDLGGLLVTLCRLCSDYAFINRVKEDFLTEHMAERLL